MRPPHLKVLSDAEVTEIHEASLRILSEVGLLVRNRQALELLAGGGADVDFETQRAKVPPRLVQAAVESAPSRFALYGRGQEPGLELAAGKTYAASGHGSVYVYDHQSDRRRDGTRQDVATFTRIADAMETVDFVAPQIFPSDVPKASSLLHAMMEIFNNTAKHVYFSIESAEVTRAVLEMARIIRGREDLSGRPIVSGQFSSSSPLTWQDGSIQCVIELAEAGVPCAILPAPFPGVTAPYTLMGLLTIHNAEVLSGVVVAQQARTGAPMIYCCSGATFDMHEGNVLLAAPEVALAQAASVQLAQRYGLPTHCCCPETDTHWLDEQHGWEKMLSITTAVRSGVDLMVNIGLLGAGLTSSFEQMVLDGEMVRMARRFQQGIASGRDSIPFDLIEQLGPGGSFLDAEHTVRNLRSGEFWDAELSNRGMYDAGMTRQDRDVLARATRKVSQILASHQPPVLDEQMNRQLAEVIRRFEADHGTT